MGILNDVLQWKKYKDDQNAQVANAIPQAVQAFIGARQQQVENQQKNVLLEIQAAQAGYKLDPNMGLVADPDSVYAQKNLLDTQVKEMKMRRDDQAIKTMGNKDKLYESMLGNGGGNSPIATGQQRLEESAKQSGYDKEDYILEPVTRMVAGVPHTVDVPKLKQPLPASARKIIDEMNPVRLGLDQNLKYLEENPAVKKFMSPKDIRAHKGGSFTGALGNLWMKLDPSKDVTEFGVFKAETDKIFQKFRKETTGAQAAMAELGWLAPDFPEADDNPKLYKKKTTEALKRIEEGYDLLLNNYSAQGYRTSEVRKAITNKGSAGKKMVIDGFTVEEV